MLTGICQGKNTPSLAAVATTAKNVPPMPIARAGTKLVNRRAIHSWMAVSRIAAATIMSH
jgi:hypothetical protein